MNNLNTFPHLGYHKIVALDNGRRYGSKLDKQRYPGAVWVVSASCMIFILHEIATKSIEHASWFPVRAHAQGLKEKDKKWN